MFDSRKHNNIIGVADDRIFVSHDSQDSIKVFSRRHLSNEEFRPFLNIPFKFKKVCEQNSECPSANFALYVMNQNKDAIYILSDYLNLFRVCLRDAKCIQFTPLMLDGLTDKLRHCVLCKEGRLIVSEFEDSVQLLAFDHSKGTGSFIDITKITLDLKKGEFRVSTVNFRNKKGSRFLPMDINGLKWAIFAENNSLVLNDIKKTGNTIYSPFENYDLLNKVSNGEFKAIFAHEKLLLINEGEHNCEENQCLNFMKMKLYEIVLDHGQFVYRIQETDESMKLALPFFCFCAKITAPPATTIRYPLESISSIASTSTALPINIPPIPPTNITLQFHLENLTKNATEHNQLIKNLNEEMKFLRAEIQRRDTERGGETRSAIESLRGELQKAKEENERCQSRWRDTLTSFEVQKRDQENVIEELKTQNEQLNKVVADIQTKLSEQLDQENVIKELQTQNEQLNEIVAEIKTKLETFLNNQQNGALKRQENFSTPTNIGTAEKSPDQPFKQMELKKEKVKKSRNWPQKIRNLNSELDNNLEGLKEKYKTYMFDNEKESGWVAKRLEELKLEHAKKTKEQQPPSSSINVELGKKLQGLNEKYKTQKRKLENREESERVANRVQKLKLDVENLSAKQVEEYLPLGIQTLQPSHPDYRFYYGGGDNNKPQKGVFKKQFGAENRFSAPKYTYRGRMPEKKCAFVQAVEEYYDDYFEKKNRKQQKNYELKVNLRNWRNARN